LYPLELGIKEKIERIAKEIYGAAEVTFLPAVLLWVFNSFREVFCFSLAVFPLFY
jgi:formyltetrahydrofolate synthetase